MDNTTFGISVFIWIVVVIGLIVYRNYRIQRSDEKRKEEIRDLLEFVSSDLRKDHFEPAELIIGSDRNTGISIDDVSKKIALINKSHDGFRYDILPYAVIIESQIIEDGFTIMHTQKSANVGKAVLGGLIAGGAGAVIGGTSGKSTTNSVEQVNQLDLVLTINNIRTPLHTLRFISSPVMKNSDFYKTHKNQALIWDSLMKIIMRQAESD
jgi:hypothetical protein